MHDWISIRVERLDSAVASLAQNKRTPIRRQPALRSSVAGGRDETGQGAGLGDVCDDAGSGSAPAGARSAECGAR